MKEHKGATLKKKPMFSKNTCRWSRTLKKGKKIFLPSIKKTDNHKVSEVSVTLVFCELC